MLLRATSPPEPKNTETKGAQHEYVPVQACATIAFGQSMQGFGLRIQDVD